MHFTQAVAIFISSEFAPSMVDTLMLVAPRLQTSINTIFIRINKCTWNDGVFDEGLNSLLLHIGKEMDHHLTTTLHHLKDGWSFLLSSAPTTGTFESTSTSFASLELHHLQLAFMAGNPRGFVVLHLV